MTISSKIVLEIATKRMTLAGEFTIALPQALEKEIISTFSRLKQRQGIKEHVLQI